MVPPDYAPGEVLVGWKPGVTSTGRAAALAMVQGKLLANLGTQKMLEAGEGISHLQVSGSTEAAIQALSKNPAVAFVEPNYRVALDAIAQDSYYSSGQLWGMQSDDSPTSYGPSGTTNQFGSGAEEAWGLGYTGQRTVVVGIIDEGIQITHPDLASNIWVNPGEVPNDGIDNDTNGYIDDVNGWDFYYDDKTVYDAGEDNHGTHVAGTIGALGDNGTGVVGVNWNVIMVPAKFLGPQGGYISDAVSALNYLTDLKTRYNLDLVAVNNSWGGGGYSSAMHTAILRAAKADILFVAAAGNSTSNNDTTASYPSNYSSLQASATETAASYESVIAVASITSSGALSSFSSYGLTTVDLGAPGSGIWSTVSTNSYASYSGTSMAAPHVTGALALYASYNTAANAAGLRTAILQNAKATASLAGKSVTGGRLSLEGLFATANQPIISISPVTATVVEGDSGNRPVQFTVSLSQAATVPVAVAYTTADGTAEAGRDYTASSGTLNFAVGETSKQVSVNVLGDTVIEADETFSVTLSAPSGASLGNAAAFGVIISDDTAPVVSISPVWPVYVEVVEGNSATRGATFTVSLSKASSETVTVDFETTDWSDYYDWAATAGQDYTAASGTLTFAPGVTSQEIIVDVRGDTAVETDELFWVDLVSASNATLPDDESWYGNVLITNDDGPMVSIGPGTVDVTEGNSGSQQIQFTVSLSAGSVETVTVTYETSDASGEYNWAATAGEDYIANSGTLTFSPGETSKQVAVTVLGDTTTELKEYFWVDLLSASGATVDGSASFSTVAITDDDLPVVSISPVSVVEGNSGVTSAQFAVALSEASSEAVTVAYATADGSAKAGQDYIAATGTVIFQAGQTSQQVSVNVYGDTAVERDETFTVALSAPSGATLGTATATGTIVSDDLPVVSISPVTVIEGNSGTKPAKFTVSLSGKSATSVTVLFSTADGTATASQDYATTSGTVTFAAGETSKQVSVIVNGDIAVETNETFTVSLSAPSGALLGSASTATGTIANDDKPVVSISPLSAVVVEGNSGVTPVQFTVSLSEAASTPVTVAYATANGSARAGQDYTAASATLTFAPGETSKQVSVDVLGDVTVEDSETFAVKLSSPSGATLGSARTASVTVTNDDLPVVSISPVTVVEGNSGQKQAKFTVSLSARSWAPVSVAWTTTDGTATAGQDYTAASGTVEFQAGQTSKTVTVNILGDTVVEGDETFTVSLSSPSGATLGTAGTAIGTIANNDRPVVSISPLTAGVIEGNSGLTPVVFTVSLSGAVSTPVTVVYATANGSARAGQDYTAASATLTFAPGETSKPVSVDVIGDIAVEGAETFTVKLSTPSGATLGTARTATATINNDDTASGSGATALAVATSDL